MANGVEGGNEIYGDDGIPPLDRERVDGRHMLDARIIDQDVNPTEFASRSRHHRLDGLRAAHIGGVIADGYAVVEGDCTTQSLDLTGVAEPIEHDVAGLCSERLGNALPDATGRSCDESRLSLQHGESCLVMEIVVGQACA